MSAGWATFLFEVANLLLLAAVLSWAFFRPVRAALEQRRAAYEADQNAARAARAEAERTLSEARAQRAEFESSLDALRQRVRNEAEAERARLIESVRAEGERERSARAAQLDSERRSQAHVLAQDAALAARDIIVRVLALLGGPDLEEGLLAVARRELERLRSAGTLGSLVVESARPLDADTVVVLAETAGVSASDLHARVDPELVAGLRIVTGRGLVDASVRGLADQVAGLLVSQLEQAGGHGG
ncbi:MAG: F0F1 ATP synthase subunit delta [Myxococcota bacterium]